VSVVLFGGSDEIANLTGGVLPIGINLHNGGVVVVDCEAKPGS